MLLLFLVLIHAFTLGLIVLAGHRRLLRLVLFYIAGSLSELLKVLQE